ncbi:hypothetical protein SAMN04244573_04415 [Azotobacter beijerinckii]|uniref:TonB-dependent Receptor Plug Domain n=1 Tax=Azotobacter beijerinckii TaxID=170623 RepID=A0A1H9SEE7_9GAMM|nr:hypothetical protein [Azotobacter beijerinckii]SER83347.1 hypothetical protein SAMN04244573_04415 [Azotobacter beijerinckii]
MIQMKAPCLLLAPILLLPDGSVRAGTEVQLSPLQVEGDQDEAAGDPVGAFIPAYQRFALPRSVAAVQTLERADIEALRPRDVSDLIEGSLGMSIGRQGARVLGDLPVEMIDSVRFLRDASVITISPLMDFGSANAGSPNQGFILIETRKSGPGKDGGELKTSYASYDTRKTLGFLGDSWLDGRLTLGGGYQRSESNGKPNWNMAYAADTWLANAGWKDEQLIASGLLLPEQGLTGDPAGRRHLHRQYPLPGQRPHARRRARQEHLEIRADGHPGHRGEPGPAVERLPHHRPHLRLDRGQGHPLRLHHHH